MMTVYIKSSSSLAALTNEECVEVAGHLGELGLDGAGVITPRACLVKAERKKLLLILE